MQELERYKGSIIGLVVGDALGTTNEFLSRGTFSPITDIIGEGPFDLEPGEWTDDTSTMLCLAKSLVDCKEFNSIDIMKNLYYWYKGGYLSSNGKCFDIGGTTELALIHFNLTSKPYTCLTDEECAANGSLMRLAPIPLFFKNAGIDRILELATENSKLTHNSSRCIEACKIMAYLITSCFQENVSKEKLMSALKSYPNLLPPSYYIHEDILKLLTGNFVNKSINEIDTDAYVVKSLECALWAFFKYDTFEEGLVTIINLGNDSDTVGAIYGQLAGCFYGESKISERWKSKIVKLNMIEEIVENLFKNRIDFS